MTKYPFPYGGAITKPNRFAGRQQEAQEILDRLRNMASSSIVGGLRIGKTSLLKYVSNDDVLRDSHIDPKKYIFVDPFGSDQRENPTSFWRNVLCEIEAKVKSDPMRNIISEAAKQPSFEQRELRSLFDAVRQQEQNIVLLLDEFESIICKDEFTISFFDDLHGLVMEHKLILITASRKELGEFCRSRYGDKSRFFTPLANINLKLFTPDEAEHLINRVMDGTERTFTPTECKDLQKITGRHPAFLHMACCFLFEAYQNPSWSSREEVKWDHVRQRLLEQMGSHLADYWFHTDKDEKRVLQTLAPSRAKQKTEPIQLTLEELQRRGKVSGGVIRNMEKQGLIFEEDRKFALFSPLVHDGMLGEPDTLDTAAKMQSAVYQSLGAPRTCILHLSDIHLGTVGEASKYLDQLATDLRELEVSRLHYLVISGDVASHSTEPEYDAAYRLVGELMREFDLNPKRVIVVPGNHDLNWDLADRAYTFTPKRKLKSPLPEGHVLAGDIGALLRNDRRHQQRFDHFAYFYQRVCGADYPLDYTKQGLLYFGVDERILFLALNSCWAIDYYYPKCASINPDALTNALGQLRGSQYEDWLKVAVWHHPVNGKEPMNDEFLERLVAHHFKVCMHGHIHEATENYFKYDRRGIRIIGAGTFGASVPEQVPGIPLQYNLLEFESQRGIITVKTRRKDKPDGKWTADARWGEDKNFPVPSYEISLS